ncbi:hypothetical protein SSABA_v1c09220 [Spiroplasma sabaudiense Ar-1343]|uniref:PvuRts1 I-like SET and RING associated domain-containing protein n=1 Tax=Spiroplasma sabaudiense Ar-1343 TaxID=1276257 RepID=W6ABF0_9MOLU|nr:hypothetical protein [Spiroplasma sabaudiense]AHI54321.1 hypothetical protein SSABA_v1c09220 [Spiroplasma sabaudiense Ar-1343]
MSNSLIHEILKKKEITTDDRITFRTILDVISSLFTDENNISSLTGTYKISENEQVWFPNFVLDKNREKEILNGYATYPSKDLTKIFQVDTHKTTENRIKLSQKQKNLNLVVFGKFFEKEKIGYHFLGVFVFDRFADEDCKVMVYKRISKKCMLR